MEQGIGECQQAGSVSCERKEEKSVRASHRRPTAQGGKIKGARRRIYQFCRPGPFAIGAF